MAARMKFDAEGGREMGTFTLPVGESDMKSLGITILAEHAAA